MVNKSDKDGPHGDASTKKNPASEHAHSGGGVICIKIMAIVPIVLVCVYQLWKGVDGAIGGKWREYAPFSYLEHPPLDTYVDGQTLARSHGFELIHHDVVTEDGYIVNVQNLKRQGEGKGPQRPVVLLAHGLIDSSDTWLVNGRNKSLAYALHDAGYDVWMSNSRGNRYSQGRHVSEKNTKKIW